MLPQISISDSELMVLSEKMVNEKIRNVYFQQNYLE